MHILSQNQDKNSRQLLLLVDDERPLLKLAKKSLTMAGFDVFPFDNPVEALEIETHIDVLVTDVVMPELSGVKMSQKLKQRFPSLKILFISGYSREVLRAEGLEGDDIQFLAKPFSVSELQEAVLRIAKSPSTTSPADNTDQA